MKWAFFVGLFHTTGSLEEGGQQVQRLSMKPDQALISAPSSPRECLKEQYEGREKHRRKEKLPQVTPLNFPLHFINQIRMTQPSLATEEAEDKGAVSQTKMKMQMEQKIQSTSAQAEDSGQHLCYLETIRMAATGQGPALRTEHAIRNSGKR